MGAKSQDDAVAAGNEDDVAGDVLWGVDEIAAFIRRTKRATFYLIARGVIPVKKHGHKTITASRTEIRAVFKPP